MTILGLKIEEIFTFLYRTLYQSNLPNNIIFLIFVVLAIVIGQIVPSLLKFILYLSDRQQEKNLHNLIFKPVFSVDHNSNKSDHDIS